MPIWTTLDAQGTPKGRLKPSKTQKIKRSPNMLAPTINQNPAKTNQRRPTVIFKSKSNRIDRQDRNSIQKRPYVHQMLDHLWTWKPCFDMVFHVWTSNSTFWRHDKNMYPVLVYFGSLFGRLWVTFGRLGSTWIDFGSTWVDFFD